MLTFISFWRAAAIVLCDLGSSAFYAGGISEQAVGASAPWFILGIMLFSFAVRAVYVESCSMFTRGGVYRVVKEALGGTFAKLSVSALMFDYILTGPISGVSAGQYITGLMNELLNVANNYHWLPPALMDAQNNPFQFDMNHTAAVFAAAVTIYYWWQNIKGIEESSGKALRVMQITTVMVVILLLWGTYSVFMKGAHLPPAPIPANLKFSTDALGFLGGRGLPLFGLFGILMAFGHSVLAMSGEESLAQVNREIEHPKLKNLKRAAIVIAIYSLIFTGGATLLASMLIPTWQRTHIYQDNLIAGLAMYMVGPMFWRSETLKMTKKAAANTMPLTVATDLVKRLTMATDSKTRNTESSPMGISVFPMRIFGGTFHPRSPWYFQRSTSMARLLKVNDQMTPKA